MFLRLGWLFGSCCCLCLGAMLLATRCIMAVQAQRHRLVGRAIGGAHTNDYGPPLQVASGVLQVSHNDDDLDDQHELNDGVSAAQIEDPWQASGLSPGYDVWWQSLAALKPQSSHGNGVFSTASATPLSKLHTRVDNGNYQHNRLLPQHATLPLPLVEHISDNIDFHNVADAQPHYTKSYGR